jgi:hypothetical protein
MTVSYRTIKIQLDSAKIIFYMRIDNIEYRSKSVVLILINSNHQVCYD